MPAMKKTKPKIVPSPAPATKPPAKKQAVAAPVPAPAKKPVAKKKPAAAALAVKPVAPKPVQTTITAIIDIGFGNQLFIRGEGPGLSWDKGVLLDCVGDDKWSITLGESARPVIFKFLVNDLSWNAGEDYSVAAGTSITLTPVF